MALKEYLMWAHKGLFGRFTYVYVFKLKKKYGLIGLVSLTSRFRGFISLLNGLVEVFCRCKTERGKGKKVRHMRRRRMVISQKERFFHNRGLTTLFIYIILLN